MAVTSTAIEDGIAVITVDNPPVNALSQAVRTGLLDAVSVLAGDADVDAIVLICAGRTFIAGADISEFDRPAVQPELPTVLDAIENSPKPVIAAIHGTALGGGLETALACHYRCALAGAKVGLPEVKLGLLPGAGGTQRLPRLAGVERALEVIVSGEFVAAPEGQQNGIVDELIEGDLRSGAIAYARRLLSTGAELRKVRELPVAPPGGEFFSQFRRRIARQTRGFYSPERCVQAVEAAVELPFDAGLARERELFRECKASNESKAQRYLFFAERGVSKVKGVGKDLPRRSVDTVAVLGAGTMGSGIAMVFANAGIPVQLLEADSAALDRALGIINKTYQEAAGKGRISPQQADERSTLINGGLNIEAAAEADLVVEAVFENLDLKREVFERLDAVAKPGAILATNTSTLNVDAIAAVTKRPEDVLGLHFFSPAPVMRLLEIVRAADTAPEVLSTAMALSRRIGKVGVVAGVCYGFIGNRMLEGYLREADAMLLEGGTPEQIDRVLYEFGMAMGPFTMIDMAGVDVGYHTREQNRQLLPPIDNYFVVSDALATLGRHGQKTGQGFYRYESGSRQPLPDPAVAELIEAKSAELGITRRTLDDDEILTRCLCPLINEGALLLDEGIAQRAADIDVVWATGYGFPVYRGGPMFYADSLGLASVVKSLGELRARLGNHWQPAPLLQRLVDENSRLCAA